MAANRFEQLVLAKVETTKGTDAVPTPSANAVKVESVTVNVETETVENPNVGKGTMGNDKPSIVKQTIVAEMTVRVIGSGTAGTAPKYGPLLEACRTVHTTTASTDDYDPSSTAATEKSATIYIYHDGLLWKMVGAVGDCTMTADIGTPATYTFKMQSGYTAPTVASVPTGASFDASSPLILTDADVITEGGTNIAVGAFTFNMGNSLTNHFTTEENTFTVDNRAPSITLSKDSVSTAADWTNLTAGGTVALVATIGSTAGNKVILTAPVAVRTTITNGERGERNLREVSYTLHESTGDDQFNIQYV